MPKINVLNLTREPDPIHEVKITSKDGLEFVFNMRALGGLGSAAAVDVYDEAVERYHGNEIKGIVAVPFPPVGEDAVLPAKSAFWLAAQLVVMQVGEEKDLYCIEEMCALMHVRPEVVTQLNARVKELGLYGGKDANPPKGETATEKSPGSP